MNILPALNIKVHWLLNNIVSQKLRYFGYVKRPSGLQSDLEIGLERTAMKRLISGKRGRGTIKEQIIFMVGCVGMCVLHRTCYIRLENTSKFE